MKFRQDRFTTCFFVKETTKKPLQVDKNATDSKQTKH